MNETDFEKRLRGHLAAKASLIEVPEHKFVQTRVVPFQPRRNRFNNLVMAAAGVAVVVMLGFGVTQVAGLNDQAGVIQTNHDSCEVTIVAGAEGYWLTASSSRASSGPLPTNLGQEITLQGGLPVIFRVFDSQEATEPIAETTMTSAESTCSFKANFSDSSGELKFDVSHR